MRLSTFIESTIFEIALGVARSKVKCKDLISVAPGDVINRAGQSEEQSFEVDIAFDVALSVASSATMSKGGDGGAEAKVRIAVVDAGMKVGGSVSKEDRQTTEQTHRVSFSIPVFLNKHHRNDTSMENEREFLDSLDRRS